MFRPFLIALSFVPAALAACPLLPSPLPSAAALPSIDTTPNPWQFFSGTPVNSTINWSECRRNELKTLVQEYMWGYYPDHTQENVTATRSGNSISITVRAGGKSASFSASLTFPSNRNGAIPVVISAGFVDSAPFVNAGVAVATFDTASIAADSNSKTGAFWTLYSGKDVGVLLAWAWAFHRVIDALELVATADIDTKRVAVVGCSRWGKAALAAGIFDDRVALTIPMSSGVYGTSPFRHRFESGGWNERLESNFQGAPWWSTSRLGQFQNNANKLPFDASIFVTLVAPRAIVFDQGQTDYQMNPQGVATVTFPAARAVYKWLGVESKIGVALRSGGHCEAGGYSNVMDFVRKTFFNATITRDYSSTGSYPAAPQTMPWTSNPPPQ